MNEIKEKPLFQATVGDVAKVLEEIITSSTSNESNKTHRADRRFAYGIKELAKVLGCSIATAQRIKSSGRLDKAISQDGRVIIVDVELALELMKNK
ncbi:DUF3853 family protein [uncultured Odoribacter sp.]|uniref:DUF3853 family protein n=1 Tax=uncultured Odoribacter sp. TaxID=876416 RepID=UPI00260FDF68|nr:DUF3853 family protein [uncultured Odoribacter sp.]